MSENRSIDGGGNNLENPDWGKSNEPLLRNIPAAYEGLNGPSGSDRPNPRLISDIVCVQDESIENEQGLSDFMWAWGQFLDHELDLSPEDSREELPIPLPGGGQIPFARSRHDSRTGTGLDNPRQQVNVISSYVDAANVYGTDPARAAVLRAFDGSGKLKLDANGFMPKNPGGVSNVPDASSQFFIAGDVRANEHAVLICMHTLFVREHNRLCDRLAGDARFSGGGRGYSRAGAGGETGEAIYQHARKIVGGLMQAVTYNEFLPALLGEDALRQYTGYNQNTNATICNVFSTACYRLGHSMLSPEIQRVGMSSIPFEDLFFRPERIEQDGIDTYLAGAATQRMQKIDTRAIRAVRELLFHNLPAPPMPPMDLAALNIQRGRDHGLPDYNTCREAYGLRRKEDFRDISSDPATQQRLRQAYDGNVNLIDPWIGGLAEDHHHDAAVGEFIFHVLKEQFERLRDGDRFWYENDLALSDQERREIARTTLADIIARNTSVSGLQNNVFKVRRGSSPRVGGRKGGGSPRPRKTAKKKTTKKK